MKHMVKFTALVCCSLAAASLFAVPETGWLRTAGGKYVYDDPTNWVNGEVNGFFGSDLTLDGAQTITFTNDLTLAQGLSIHYDGAYGMTFQSAAKDENDAPRPITLTLGGDIVVDTVKDNGSIIIKVGAGSTDPASNGVTINLGGVSRTVSVTKSKVALQILNKVTNGGLVLENTGSVRLDGTTNDYGLGTTFRGTGTVNVMNDALGTGNITVENAVLATGSSDCTFTRNNKLILDGTLKFSSSKKKLNLGSGDIFINRPVTIEASNGTLILGGQVAADSPYRLESVTKAGGETLQTVADVVSDKDVTLTATQGTWLFDGAVRTTGKLAVSGGWNYGSGGIRLSSANNSFAGPVVIEGRENAVSLVFTAEGSLPDGVTFLLKDNGVLQSSTPYSCEYFIENHLIDTASTGIFCVGVGGSTETVDLSDYPNLYFGAGGNQTFNGQIIPHESGYRLGGANYLYIAGANALSGKRDVYIKKGVYINNINNLEGTVHVPRGETLNMSNSNGTVGQLPNAQIIVEHEGTLVLNPGNTFTGVVANKLTLHSSKLSFTGASGKAISCKINELELEPAAQYGGIPQFSWSQNSSVNLTLRIGKVSRRYPIPLNFQTDPANLGLTESTSGCNIIFEDGSATPIGVEGSSAVPVVPWVRYNGAFLTYDAVKGFQSIPESAMEVYAASQELDATSQVGAHLYAKGNGSSEVAVKFLKETVLTSLRTGYQVKTIRVQTGDDAVIKIPTGAVFEDGNTRPYIEAAIDFGDARGYIFDRQGKAQEFKGLISGTGGLTLAHYGTSNITGSTGGPGLVCHFADSTFTGDVHSFTRIDEASQGAFPYGKRSGNFYLHGYWLCSNNPVSLNGLYGAGYLRLQNGYNGALFTLGCDGSDGDFEGQISRSSGTLSLTKIGAGRQRFGGECTHNGATTVSNGTLQVDGAFTQSAVTVAEGATLAGCGTFGKAVTLAAGAKLEVGSAKLGESDAEMNFEGGITFKGDSAVTFKVLGKTAVAKLVGAPTIEDGKLTISLDSKDLKGGEYCLFESSSELNIADYLRGANCGPLFLREGGKQLWMRKNTSLIITLR